MKRRIVLLKSKKKLLNILAVLVILTVLIISIIPIIPLEVWASDIFGNNVATDTANEGDTGRTVWSLYNLPADGTVTSITADTLNAVEDTENVTFAIYDASYNLLAHTGTVSVPADDVAHWLSSAISVGSIHLTAGNYNLAIMTDSGNSYFYRSAATGNHVYATYGATFPTFPSTISVTWTFFTDYGISIYATYTPDVTTVATYSPSGQSGNWTNPTYAYSSDNQYATFTGTSHTTTLSDNPTAYSGTTPWTNPANGESEDNSNWATAAYGDTTTSANNPTSDDTSGGTIQLAYDALPTSDKSKSGTWTESSGSTMYNLVNEDPSDNIAANTSTYITCTVAGYQYENYTAFTIPAGATIVDVAVYVDCDKSSGSTCTAYATLWANGAAADNGTALAPANGSYAWKASTWAKDPGGTNAWTVNEVNGVSGSYPITGFGTHASTDTAHLNVAAEYIVIDYTYATYDYANVNGGASPNDLDSATIYAASGSTYLIFGFTAFSVPANARNIRLKITYRTCIESPVGGTSNIRAGIIVGGSTYYTTDTGVAPAILVADSTYTFSVNPKTSAAWTVADINNAGGASNPLQYFGVSSSDSTPTVEVNNVYAQVIYYVPQDEEYGTFGVTGSATITKVEIGYDAYCSVASQNMYIYECADGSTYTSHTISSMATSDPSSYTYIDVTSDPAGGWTWTKLNNTNFFIKVMPYWVSGSPTWYLDGLIVRVTYFDVTNCTQSYTTYGISLAGNTITKVEVGIEAYAASSETVNLDVSKDNGSTWSTAQTSSALAGSDPNSTTWFDFTSYTTWTPALLADGTFQARIKYNDSGSLGTVYLDYIPVRVTYTAINISNSPATTLDFGMVMPGTTYYAYNQSTGTYPNPVTSSQCHFTITNNGTASVNLALSCSNATGGNTWTLVQTTPTGDQFEVIAVYNTEDPASGLVLTNANQSFYTGLAASGTLLWDFKEILGGTGTGKAGTFSDSAVKTFTITITGS